jgi:hypothetical protein
MSSTGRVARCFLALNMALAMVSQVHAHIASNGFLVAHIDAQNVTGSIELSVRDAALAVAVDANGDGKVTWGELRTAEAPLIEYIGRHFSLATMRRPCQLKFQALEINDRVDGNYVWFPFTASCPEKIRRLTIQYDLMADIDPSHRGLLTLRAADHVQTAVLGGSAAQASFAVFAPSRSRAFFEYYQAGVLHILSGIDHLLFLLSLLLPAVLFRDGRQWQPVAQARSAVISILKVVTAFTLAHSLTLTLAALDVVRLPSRLTESVIAGSIIVAALNNIFPLVTESRARIAFAFGLLHGFGFASVLTDMGLPQGARLISLLAFNLGIETGQLVVVLAVMPVVYWLRSGIFYRRALMPFGSAAIAALALVWLVQRAFWPTV